MILSHFRHWRDTLEINGNTGICEKRQRNKMCSEVTQYKWLHTLGILIFYPEFFTFSLALVIEQHWKVQVPLCITHFFSFRINLWGFLLNQSTAAMQNSFHVRFLWAAPRPGCSVPNTAVLWEHRNFQTAPAESHEIEINWHLLKYSKSSLAWTYSGISPVPLSELWRRPWMGLHW